MLFKSIYPPSFSSLKFAVYGRVGSLVEGFFFGGLIKQYGAETEWCIWVNSENGVVLAGLSRFA